ncbi:hypothetical protein [Stakelama saccharophila]|uniref:Phage shock protein B n=1 Tax=Stakelama saccharophila TaxID=3075605 RepID=A0ABZ0B5T6_9SPHN|nr:hypothetical protein [Stakelama sp. W311]WNO52762.1 hypothetical protein RPR59_09835 [Stakelama sp. W311]
MNGFTVFMLALVVIGLPVGGGLIFAAYERMLKHRENMAGSLNAQAAEKAAQYAAQTERLEQRVRVLERIVTEKGIDVADEIERLRDRPLN